MGLIEPPNIGLQGFFQLSGHHSAVFRLQSSVRPFIQPERAERDHPIQPPDA
jgi:hypothetical protein